MSKTFRNECWYFVFNQDTMKKLILVLLSLLLLVACKTAKTISSSEVPVLDSTYSVRVCDTAYHIVQRSYGAPDFLGTFEIYDVDADSIFLHFEGKDTFVITYLDNMDFKTKKFKGHFDKKGYFEIYLHNERIEIPPFIYILFSRHNIKRVRLSLSPDQALLLDNYWFQGGNILILGAGDSGRRKSYYKTY